MPSLAEQKKKEFQLEHKIRLAGTILGKVIIILTNGLVSLVSVLIIATMTQNFESNKV